MDVACALNTHSYFALSGIRDSDAIGNRVSGCAKIWRYSLEWKRCAAAGGTGSSICDMRQDEKLASFIFLAWLTSLRRTYELICFQLKLYFLHETLNLKLYYIFAIR